MIVEAKSRYANCLEFVYYEFLRTTPILQASPSIGVVAVIAAAAATAAAIMRRPPARRSTASFLLAARFIRAPRRSRNACRRLRTARVQTQTVRSASKI